MATYQVRENSAKEKFLSPPLSWLEGGLATEDAPGVVRPDGKTVRVDNTGVLSAIGGNLLLNSEEWITESGTFTAPVDGLYAGEMWSGGWGSIAETGVGAIIGGNSGSWKRFFVYLTAGQQIPVVVGAGGAGKMLDALSVPANIGGDTSFGDITVSAEGGAISARGTAFPGTSIAATTEVKHYFAQGGGIGANAGGAWKQDLSQAENNARQNAFGHLGAGGTAMRSGNNYAAGAGAQGSIYLCWYDPARAKGPTEQES